MHSTRHTAFQGDLTIKLVDMGLARQIEAAPIAPTTTLTTFDVQMTKPIPSTMFVNPSYLPPPKGNFRVSRSWDLRLHGPRGHQASKHLTNSPLTHPETSSNTALILREALTEKPNANMDMWGLGITSVELSSNQPPTTMLRTEEEVRRNPLMKLTCE